MYPCVNIHIYPCNTVVLLTRGVEHNNRVLLLFDKSSEVCIANMMDTIFRFLPGRFWRRWWWGLLRTKERNQIRL